MAPNDGLLVMAVRRAGVHGTTDDAVELGSGVSHGVSVGRSEASKDNDTEIS